MKRSRSSSSNSSCTQQHHQQTEQIVLEYEKKGNRRLIAYLLNARAFCLCYILFWIWLLLFMLIMTQLLWEFFRFYCARMWICIVYMFLFLYFLFTLSLYQFGAVCFLCVLLWHCYCCCCGNFRVNYDRQMNMISCIKCMWLTRLRTSSSASHDSAVKFCSRKFSTGRRVLEFKSNVSKCFMMDSIGLAWWRLQDSR